MNAQEARALAHKFKTGSGEFNKTIYNTAIQEIKKAAKNGKYSVKFQIYTADQIKCIGVVNKLMSEGYGVTYNYHPDPGPHFVGKAPNDYMEFKVTWKE